jgi:hypothetical protein
MKIDLTELEREGVACICCDQNTECWPECVHTVMNFGQYKLMEISWLYEEMLTYKEGRVSS